MRAAVLDFLNEGIEKDVRGIRKIHTVFAQIGQSLVAIPLELHAQRLRKFRTGVKTSRCGGPTNAARLKNII